jgi:hypothetical protein
MKSLHSLEKLKYLSDVLYTFNQVTLIDGNVKWVANHTIPIKPSIVIGNVVSIRNIGLAVITNLCSSTDFTGIILESCYDYPFEPVQISFDLLEGIEYLYLCDYINDIDYRANKLSKEKESKEDEVNEIFEKFKNDIAILSENYSKLIKEKM